MVPCCVVTTTVAHEAAALELAEAVVQRRLGACAQVDGPISSTYWWEGKVERSTEWRIVIKTTAMRCADLIAHLQGTHPYEQPEIIAQTVTGGDEGYLEWIARTTADATAAITPPPAT